MTCWEHYMAAMDKPAAPKPRPVQVPASNSEARKRAQRAAIIPPHIAIRESAGEADCGICNQGINAPASFGGIPRSDMLASFVVQHSVHTKAGNASGLTASGRPSKAALAYMGGLS